jgi:hypothetical protein
MRVNVNLIERAVGLGAEIVRALTDRAVDIGVFLIVHSALRSFPHWQSAAVQYHSARFSAEYASGMKNDADSCVFMRFARKIRYRRMKEKTKA